MNEKVVNVLWIDLDGTVRHGKDELGFFADKPEQVELFAGVTAILHLYKRAGWRIVGVSNQGGVAMGHLSFEAVVAMMRRTQELTGDVFDRIYSCVHHPDAPDPLLGNCWCRKPRIGMLVDAGLSMSQQHDEIYPPSRGLFVGDRPEDQQCAENAGLPFEWASEWRAGAFRKWL